MELKLVAQRTDNGFRQEVPLGTSDVKIGRNSDCQLTLPCDQKIVSRVHAIVHFNNGRHELADAGSANGVTLVSKGTQLDPQRPHPLSEGEEFAIGQFRIRVERVQAANPGPTANPGSTASAGQAIAAASEAVARQQPLPRPGGVSRTLGRQQPEPKPATPAADIPSAIADTDTQSISEAKPEPIGDPFAAPKEEPAVFTANSSDHFAPPSITIPDDWDLDGVAETATAKPTEQTLQLQQQEKKRQADVLSFNQQQHRLVASLLKGLHAGDQFQAADISGEQLEVVGQTLRVLADTALKALHGHREIKSRLCLDAPAVERELSKDPIYDISNGDALLNILLDNRHPRQKDIPGMLLESMEALIEDEQVLEQTTLQAFDQAIDELSPVRVQQLMETQSEADRTSISFKHKLSPGAAKWSFFEDHWPKAGDRIRQDIHKTFEKRILQLTARRAKR
ncbi:FHA domain-containing protein [Oceanobacter kriegii]|uniref:FHA domain-containing protein n=1 Tax=Oceanobacter kriegii TaxID=64972 RepID=UPI0003F4B7EB|nr:FHA domain-containing protein [Oceanobacter kriegii]